MRSYFRRRLPEESNYCPPDLCSTKRRRADRIRGPLALSSAEHGVVSQPIKVSFRANKNRCITDNVDGYRTAFQSRELSVSTKEAMGLPHISEEIPRRAFKLHYPWALWPFIVQPLIPHPDRNLFAGHGPTSTSAIPGAQPPNSRLRNLCSHLPQDFHTHHTIIAVPSAPFLRPTVRSCPAGTSWRCCDQLSLLHRVRTTNRLVYVQEPRSSHTDDLIGVLAMSDSTVSYIAQTPRQDF
uniref:Uncharacterized protein n=1 Tax=Timema bartmani TaxID=61472 RepID=A0A7R9I7M9_9NEOP|nr:unnamed protein product [Timema bartmani]